MAGKEDVKLLGWLPSPYVIRVRIALSMKGVSYEYMEEDFLNKSPLLRASNPNKKVPVLIHNGKPICDSLLIMQYIDLVWRGAPILPADPYERVRALFWVAYVDSRLHPALMSLVRASMEESRSERIKDLHRAISLVERTLADYSPEFFGSDSIGFLDITAGSHFILLEALGKTDGVEFVNAAGFPLLAALAARFRDNAAAKNVIPEVDRAVEHIKKLRATIASALAVAKL